MSFDFLSSQSWLIYHDRDNSRNKDPISSLVYEDSFIRYLPKLNEETQDQQIGGIHFYPNLDPVILLGGKDTRLSNKEAGYAYLQEVGYKLVVRPHGGLAVVNDSGIVNFSLITDMGEDKIPIDQAYEYITRVVQEILEPYGLIVEHYEVENSYCPGTYDLVVNGQKIGGTAQRRFKSGLTTAAYLSLNGNQKERAEHIREFYERSDADETYPSVDWRVMTTISDLIGKDFTQQDFENDLTKLFSKYTTFEYRDFSDTELENIYTKQYPILKKRNNTLPS
ncbi:hypothetical protein HYO62_05145 [Aerococcaceae bacterium DSM 111022]|nr:hypothetical protein [Aerococcaceae bacterium DSM 111022]